MRWLAMLIFASAATLGVRAQEQRSFDVVRRERSEELAKRATDRNTAGSGSDTALAELEHSDFETAFQVAPALLSAEDPLLRIRASWILASGGESTGVHSLMELATDRTEESLVAMEMLGRLRDPAAHSLLRTLLEKELDSIADELRRGRIFRLVLSLSDYADKKDASLLVRAVGPGAVSWVDADAIGRTGSADGVPALDRIFGRTGKVWAVMAAGLGLARCGSERGLTYVRARLADRSGDSNKPNLSYPTNAETDDPNGPKATDFILAHLGVLADEVFVPDLVRIVAGSEYSSRPKAMAWEALVKINSASYRRELLDLAWKNLSSEGAAKYVVLNDESKARKSVEGVKPERASYEQWTLRHALSATPRERRRWREVHGYSF